MASPSSATDTATETTSIASTTTTGSDQGPTTVYSTFTISGSVPSTTTIITAASTQTFLLGPLTTTFTAPTHCSQAYWLSDSSQIYDPTIGQTCATTTVVDDDGEIGYDQDSSCLPPVASTVLASLVGSSEVIYTTYDYRGYYSPGIACPTGYTTACAAQAGSDGIQSALSDFQSFGFVYSATADETVVGCCPTGYQCTSILSSQWCQHIIASTTQPLVTCQNGTDGVPASATTQFTLPTIVTLSASDTLLSTEITSTIKLTTLSMLATMVQIKYQASDIVSTSSPSSSSSLSSTLLPTYPTTTSGSSSSSNHHKTTTIAVSVVIPCVAALIAASLGWLWYRRRAKKQSSPSYQTAQSIEPSSNSYYGTGSEPTEMVGDPARLEMEGSPIMYEMAGTEPNMVTHEMYAGK